MAPTAAPPPTHPANSPPSAEQFCVKLSPPAAFAIPPPMALPAMPPTMETTPTPRELAAPAPRAAPLRPPPARLPASRPTNVEIVPAPCAPAPIAPREMAASTAVTAAFVPCEPRQATHLGQGHVGPLPVIVAVHLTI